MGKYVPQDVFVIGITLLVLSFVYSFLSIYFAPRINPDPLGMPNILTNYGFCTTSFILLLVGLFFIVLGVIYKYYYEKI